MSSWLFTHGDRSIYIVRPHRMCVLQIYGPGRARQEETFPSESALQRYQIAMAESLAAAGWMSYEMNYDRRSSDRRFAEDTSRPESVAAILSV